MEILLVQENAGSYTTLQYVPTQKIRNLASDIDHIE
jgi:hypothetical protein